MTANNVYPLAREAEGTNDVYIGRIRRDFSIDNGINFWCVADNIRKGAAANAVQIAFRLNRRRLNLTLSGPAPDKILRRNYYVHYFTEAVWLWSHHSGQQD